MRIVAAVFLVALGAGCSSPRNDRPTGTVQTQRQHDSALGASKLPGATGISAAQRLADSAEARRRREDSAGRNQ